MIEIELTPALFSAVAASVAAVVAIAAFLINRRTYRITSKQDRSRQPKLQLYLESSQIHYFPSESARYIDCAVRVTNASDSPNSIARLRLSLTRGRAGVSTTLEVEPTGRLPLADDMPASPLQVPCHLAPRAVVAGRAVFRVDNALLEGRRRLRYELAVIDAHGLVETTRIILMNEHDHGAKTSDNSPESA